MYSDLEKKSESNVLINYLLALLGISMLDGDGKEMHYIVLEEFINDTLTDYSYEEIKLAFKNLIKGDYPEIQVYNKLDSILVGKVMRAFDNQKQYAINQEKIRKQKLEVQEVELTQSEKDAIVINGLVALFDEVKEQNNFPSSRVYLYNWFYNRNLLPKDVSTKKVVAKIAKENLGKKKVGLPVNCEKLEDELLKETLNKVIEGINTSTNEFITECHRITLERFFNQFKDVKQLLSKIK